jgi:hypothetical protein
MSLEHQHSATLGQKRQARDPIVEYRKRAKADRERFRRGKRETFRRLNDLFLDSLSSGRERRVYAVVMNKTKDSRGTIWYSTYNSHPHKNWIPPAEEVVSTLYLLHPRLDLIHIIYIRRNIGQDLNYGSPKISKGRKTHQ